MEFESELLVARTPAVWMCCSDWTKQPYTHLQRLHFLSRHEQPPFNPTTAHKAPFQPAVSSALVLLLLLLLLLLLPSCSWRGESPPTEATGERASRQSTLLFRTCDPTEPSGQVWSQLVEWILV